MTHVDPQIALQQAVPMDTVTFNIVGERIPVRCLDEEGEPIESSEEIWYIAAGNARGDRWVHAEDFQTQDAARGHLPVAQAESLDGDTWRPIEPVYGSAAWGAEDEYALACFEADCFSEPRPNWY